MKIWSKHAVNRATTRLSSVVTEDDVRRVNEYCRRHRRELNSKKYLFVRRLGSLVHLEDCDNDDINGDVLVAIVKSGVVASIMVGKSWRSDYFSDGEIVHL